jgi:predicted short-subunit dehydrogenase-like oxidoreductase (DUF2520 family)
VRTKPNKKPQVAIVGAGRVGRALGRILHQHNWPIGAVVTRSARTARAAAKFIGAGKPHATLDATILDADVILIATPDAAIPAVAKTLAQMEGTSPGGSPHPTSSRHKGRKKIVLHTSGALDGAALRPLERLRTATGTLHPLQTFTGRGIPNLKGTACAIDGNPAALTCAKRICKDLGCVPIRIPATSRPAYHAAAVLAAGHVLAAEEAATQVLMTLGFSRKKAVQALLPLTRQVLSNFERDGGPKSWTGPAARGDAQTIKKHREALRRFPREYREAYAALTRLGILLLTQKPSRSPQHQRKQP